jgi:MFS family permease
LYTAIAAAIGTGLEFFDFGLMGTLAVIIGPTFFPSKDPIPSLLYLFAIYAVGFLFRPLGGIIFGALSDRGLGRKDTLIITILMMAATSGAMGLMPTYAQIGIWSTVILVIIRMVQGLALGGEFGGGISITAENAPAKKRGFYVSIAQMAQGLPLGSAVVGILATVMAPADFSAYGWRYAFFVGVAIALVALGIRFGVTEPTKKAQPSATKPKGIPVVNLCMNYPRQVLLSLGLVMGATILTYTIGTYGMTYAYTFGKIPYSTCIWTWAFGALIFSARALWLMSSGNFYYVVLSLIIAYSLFSMMNGQYASCMAEFFPTDVGYTGVSFTYQLAVGIFGGFTPFIATFLVSQTGNPLSVTAWLEIGIIVCLISSWLVKESRSTELK